MNPTGPTVRTWQEQTPQNSLRARKAGVLPVLQGLGFRVTWTPDDLLFGEPA